MEYAYQDISEVRKNPELFREFAGVLYYNDQEIELPPEMPAMQIFGWTSPGPCQDRITVDDVRIAELGVQFFLNAGSVLKALHYYGVIACFIAGAVIGSVLLKKFGMNVLLLMPACLLTVFFLTTSRRQLVQLRRFLKRRK